MSAASESFWVRLGTIPAGYHSSRRLKIFLQRPPPEHGANSEKFEARWLAPGLIIPPDPTPPKTANRAASRRSPNLLCKCRPVFTFW